RRPTAVLFPYTTLFRSRFGGANCAAFSPDGQILAVGTAALHQNLYFFRVADGELIRTVAAHSNGTTGVAFTPDGALLVSGGRDRSEEHTSELQSRVDLV